MAKGEAGQGSKLVEAKKKHELKKLK